MFHIGEILNGVLFGHNDHLFLTDGGHDVLEFVSGKRTVPDGTVRNFWSNIARRKSITSKRNVGYLHVICPDKQTVLTDDYPLGTPNSLGAYFMERMGEQLQYVMFPRKLLQAIGTSAYAKTDTHLSDRANTVLTASIVERLTGESQEEILSQLLAEIVVPETRSGDLGNRFTPPITEIAVNRQFPATHRVFLNGYPGNDGIIDILINRSPIYNRRILVFGDSFGRAVAWSLLSWFSEILFLRTRFFHDEMFEQFSPDFVITENVERYLDTCDLDEERPSFMLYPFFSPEAYQPDPDFCRALSAVLSYPRPPYRQFMASLS